MIIMKPASELQVGDELSTSGAVIEAVVPSHRGTKTYIRAKFDDGYTQVVTIDADTPVYLFVHDKDGPGCESVSE